MTNLVVLTFVAALAFLIVQRLRTLLTYFQQEEYDGPRFVVSCRAVRLYDVRASLAVLAGAGLIALGLAKALVLGLLAIDFLVIAWIEQRYRFKKPLVLTARARRIYALAAALVAPLVIGSFFVPLVAMAALQLAPLLLVAANAILQPFQQRINNGYIAQGREKLARLSPVCIGITGSFGKTTVKHMLAEILEASGPVFYSRGSINTILGHTRHIRERLQWSHRYFVAEMGAYGIGSIRRLCDFIHPHYGIVTAVGDAHTERFGSLDAIATAKAELAEAICSVGGIVVINEDLLKYEPFWQIKERHGRHVVSVGAEKADVTIEAQEIPGGVWSIALRSSVGHVSDVSYELSLLGAHNVMNSALAVTLALIIDNSTAGQIPYFTKTIEQIPHRLQKHEQPGAVLILDDTYNSNEQGFMSAVSSLDKLARERGGRRILVTPGIAELGLEHDRVHTRLGAYCSDKCDIVHVVNPVRIRSFVDAIDKGRVEIIEAASLAEARQAIFRDLRPEDVVLYENDLPDLLEEKRFL